MDDFVLCAPWFNTKTKCSCHEDIEVTWVILLVFLFLFSYNIKVKKIMDKNSVSMRDQVLECWCHSENE